MFTWRSLALDSAGILVFAAIGRSSHAEGLTPVGVLVTAWPFLAGCLLGALLARALHLGYWASGVLTWLSAVLIGMVLRVLTGPGTQLSFIIVATITLGVLLLGWRGLARLVRRAALRQAQGTEGSSRDP